MPINITYEPYGAIGELAKKSGEAKAQQQQNVINTQMAMAKNQAEAHVASQKFQAQVQMQIEQARMDFQSNMNAQKLQIAGQLEIQEFQRKQMKLQGLMNQIDESEYLTDKEKDMMKTDATAKFGDITLDRSFFAAPKPSVYQDAAEQLNAYNQLVNVNGVDPKVAASSVGLKEVPQTKLESLRDEYNQIASDMGMYMDPKTGKVTDPEGYAINEAAAKKIKTKIDIETISIKYAGYAPDDIVSAIGQTNPATAKTLSKEIARLRKQKVSESTIRDMLIVGQALSIAPEEEKDEPWYKNPKLGWNMGKQTIRSRTLTGN